MPRRSKVVIVRPASTQKGRIRSLGVRIQGRPSEPTVTQTFPVVPKPSYRRAGIRRLQKVDVSKGLSMPEANNLPFVAGVIGAAQGVVRIVLQHPVVPVKLGRNQRVLKAPSPTNSAGVRDPRNASRRVGGRGNSKRFKG